MRDTSAYTRIDLGKTEPFLRDKEGNEIKEIIKSRSRVHKSNAETIAICDGQYNGRPPAEMRHLRT